MKTLVTYYSQSGNTAALAHQIALRLGADEEPIHEMEPRNGTWGLVTGAIGAAFGQSSDIASAGVDPAEYDLVLIGTPVWMGGAAPSVNGFLDKYGSDCKKVAFFCTESGNGDQRTFSRMGKRLGMQPVSCLAVTEDELSNGALDEKLDRFRSELGEAVA